MERKKLKEDLEIIKGNVGAALKALEEGDPNREPDGILKDHIAQAKIKTFQIGMILDQQRRCTAPTCVALGRYRPDLKAVLCEKHYSRAKRDGNRKNIPR